MKKTAFIAFIMMAFGILNLQAQYFTLKLAGGYAWPGIQSSENIMAPKIEPLHPDVDGLGPMANIVDSMNGKAPSYKAVHGSYGKGMNFTFAFGYMINRYIGVELGVSYLKSATITSDQTRQLTIPTYPGYSYLPYYLNAHTETNAFGLSVMPSIIVQGAKPGWKVYPYARVGISLPVFGGLTDKISIDQNAPAGLQPILDTAPYYLGKHTDVTLKTQGTISIGINGAIGVKYDPLPYLGVFLELNGQYLVTRAKSAEITQWDADGKSILDQRPVYRRQFNFVDELTGSSNNTDYNAKTDPNKPKDDIRPTGAFSNIGINVGITFHLSKEILKGKPKEKKK